jgi:hypothetical protein
MWFSTPVQEAAAAEQQQQVQGMQEHQPAAQEHKVIRKQQSPHSQRH